MPRTTRKQQRKHPSTEQPVGIREMFTLSGQSVGWTVLSVWSILGWLPALTTMTIEWLRSLKEDDKK